MAAQPDWLPSILAEEDFQKYHAFFNTFKHNHKAHSTIAYARLGASEERVKHHCKVKNERGGLIPFNKDKPLTQKTEQDLLKSNNIEDYKGANEAYYKVLQHFTDLYETKYEKDVKKMIAEEFPSIGDGPVVAAFHGVIQMGYGYVANSDVVVLEGLAYNFSQYSPFEPKDKTVLTDSSNFGKGSKDILEVLKEIRDDRAMFENVSKLSNDEKYEKKNFLDWYGMAFLEHYSDRFLKLTDDIKLPDWFDPLKEDMEQYVNLLRWVEDMTTTVYVKSDLVNQFFLLHGITGSWCLRQVIELLTSKEALHLLRTHLASYLVVYATTGSPELNKQPEDYWKGEQVDQASWDVVLKDVIAKDFEDHIPKVVQIMYEKWMEEKGGANCKFYIGAARMAIDNMYNVFPFPADFISSNVIKD